MSDKSETDREINATTRWGISTLIVIILQAGAWIYWAASLQVYVDENTKDIVSLQEDVDTIEDDIRNILVGIEAIKAGVGVK